MPTAPPTVAIVASSQAKSVSLTSTRAGCGTYSGVAIDVRVTDAVQTALGPQFRSDGVRLGSRAGPVHAHKLQRAEVS